jgi:iron complex transport system ATP-binding protein
MGAALSTVGLAIGYGKAPKRRIVAEGISLSLYSGSLVALVGPNGAGKSTLLRTLARLQEPLTGEVFVDGIAMSSLDRLERARKVSVAFTDPIAADYHSVFDIAAFGRYPYTDSRNTLSKQDREHVTAALEAVGLAEFASRQFSELSDGERQKTVIARALAQTTRLVLLDEPTAFLDAASRIELMHVLAGVARLRDALVIVSTHDIDLALRTSDKVLIFGRDRALRCETPEDAALSGLVGDSFDTAKSRFDLTNGRFVAETPAKPIPFGLRGDDDIAVAWTRHALRRCAFAERAGAEECIVVSSASGTRRWTMPDGSVAGSLAEVLAWLHARAT